LPVALDAASPAVLPAPDDEEEDDEDDEDDGDLG
jgi:hypothetical protein